MRKLFEPLRQLVKKEEEVQCELQIGEGQVPWDGVLRRELQIDVGQVQSAMVRYLFDLQLTQHDDVGSKFTKYYQCWRDLVDRQPFCNLTLDNRTDHVDLLVGALLKGYLGVGVYRKWVEPFHLIPAEYLNDIQGLRELWWGNPPLETPLYLALEHFKAEQALHCHYWAICWINTTMWQLTRTIQVKVEFDDMRAQAMQGWVIIKGEVPIVSFPMTKTIKEGSVCFFLDQYIDMFHRIRNIGGYNLEICITSLDLPLDVTLPLVQPQVKSSSYFFDGSLMDRGLLWQDQIVFPACWAPCLEDRHLGIGHRGDIDKWRKLILPSPPGQKPEPLFIEGSLQKIVTAKGMELDFADIQLDEEGFPVLSDLERDLINRGFN